MKNNVPVQAYLPPHLAAWLEAEARKAKVSRSHWIGATMMDLFKGQDLREETRAVTSVMLRHLAFLFCAIEELLQAHQDSELPHRVQHAFRSRLGFNHSEQD